MLDQGESLRSPSTEENEVLEIVCGDLNSSLHSLCPCAPGMEEVEKSGVKLSRKKG